MKQLLSYKGILGKVRALYWMFLENAMTVCVRCTQHYITYCRFHKCVSIFRLPSSTVSSSFYNSFYVLWRVVSSRWQDGGSTDLYIGFVGLTMLLISGVTILLSLTVFLNLVAETLPQVSDAIPLLGTHSEPRTPDILPYFLFSFFHDTYFNFDLFNIFLFFCTIIIIFILFKLNTKYYFKTLQGVNYVQLK